MGAAWSSGLGKRYARNAGNLRSPYPLFRESRCACERQFAAEGRRPRRKKGLAYVTEAGTPSDACPAQVPHTPTPAGRPPASTDALSPSPALRVYGGKETQTAAARRDTGDRRTPLSCPPSLLPPSYLLTR